MIRRCEEHQTNRNHSALPALGVLTILCASALWAPPSLGILSADDGLSRVGTIAACSIGEDDASEGQQYGAPFQAESKDNTDGLSTFSSLGTSGGGGGSLPSNTYYLRADGTAPNKSSATGCDSPSTAMKIATHDNQVYSPGDTIVLCSEGGVFRDTLRVHSSGDPGSQISIVGRNTAVISASDLVSGWNPDGGNVYRATLGSRPQQVFTDGQFGDRKANRSQLVNNLDWYWGSNTLYLYSSSGDPDQVHTNPGVESSVRDNAILISNYDYITLTGLTARHAQQAGIEIVGDCDGITVRRSTFEWNFFEGLRKNAWDAVSHDQGLFEYNTARYNGASGFLINTEHKDNVVRRNTVYENGKYQGSYDSRQVWTAGIKMWSNYRISRAIIEENIVFDNGPGGDDMSKGNGIWLDGCAGPEGPNIVRNNLVYGNNSFGIFIEVSSNSEVHNNVLYDNADALYSAGIGVKSHGNYVASGNYIHNNTVVGSQRWGFYCGVYDDGGVPKIFDTTFVNNIVVGSQDANLFIQNACVNDGYYGSGNIYQYNTLGTQRPGFINVDWTPLSTYNAWEGAISQNTYSIQTDPTFFNLQQRQLWLAEGSSGIDDGLNLGTDRSDGLQELSQWPDWVRNANQNQHGTAWELGAYVSTTSPYIPPPQ